MCLPSKPQSLFLPTGDSEIELVKPTTANGTGALLGKAGPGMHHVYAWKWTILLGCWLNSKIKGIQLINEEPKIASDGRRYAFVHPKSANGVMVELYQLPE